MTPGMGGDTPWVYLRYIKDDNSIDYIRLEPNMPDPVDRVKAAQPARRRRR